MIGIPCRLEPDHPGLPSRPAQRYMPAIVPPESQDVAVVDAAHARGGIKKLSQVFTSPAIRPEPMLAQAMKIDHDQVNLARVELEPLTIEINMAEVQVFVEDAGPVQRGGDPGKLGDESPFEGGESGGVELSSKLG